MPDQLKELDRVKNNIGFLVFQFIRKCWLHGDGTFYMSQLYTYVRGQITTAPGSAGRVMRALRQDGYFDYVVLDRKNSHYMITDVFDVGRRVPTPKVRKVKVKVWRLTWQDGDSDVYFTEEEARRGDCSDHSDCRYCTIAEEIVEAIRA